MVPVRRQEQRVTGVEVDGEGKGVLEQRMAREVGVGHVDEREVVDLTPGPAPLEASRRDALQVLQVCDAWVGVSRRAGSMMVNHPTQISGGAPSPASRSARRRPSAASSPRSCVLSVYLVSSSSCGGSAGSPNSAKSREGDCCTEMCSSSPAADARLGQGIHERLLDAVWVHHDTPVLRVVFAMVEFRTI